MLSIDGSRSHDPDHVPVSFPAPYTPRSTHRHSGSTVVKSHTLLPLGGSYEHSHQSFRFCVCITLAALKPERLISESSAMGSFSSVRHVRGKRTRTCVNVQKMYSCNLLANARQVDLRFKPILVSISGLPMPEYSSVSDQRCFIRRRTTGL
jgi:hypothetical protein